MTRFACFWVEEGQIVAPINVMRFDETLYRVLGENLIDLTCEREMILDAFEAEQIPVTELVATGGLAERSPLLLRIYADITQRPIRLAASPNASALGAAILGALAAGAERGGHGSLEAAVEQMAGLATETIEPDGEAARQYEALYKEYLELHDHFGRGGSAVMSRLRRLRR